MGDISVKFGAEEDVSKAARQVAGALNEVQKELGETESKGKGAADGLEKVEKSAKVAGGSLIALNQGLELAKKGWAFVSEAARIATDFLLDSARASMEAERSERALAAALGGGAEAVSDAADAVQRKTGADADNLRQQAAVLASMGLTSDQIARALPGLSAYADVTGKDVSRAVQTLGKSLQEGKLDQEIARLSQFQAAAEGQSQTFSGELRKLTSELGELQETIGASITESDRLAQTFAVLTGEVRNLNGEAEGLNTVLGDVAAEGIEQIVRTANLATESVRQLVQPTEAWGAGLQSLVGSASPATQSILRLFGVIEEGDQAIAGLDRLSDATGDLAGELDKIKASDGPDPNLFADNATRAAQIAEREREAEEKASEIRKKAREKAAKEEKAQREKLHAEHLKEIEDQEEAAIKLRAKWAREAEEHKGKKDAEKLLADKKWDDFRRESQRRMSLDQENLAAVKGQADDLMKAFEEEATKGAVAGGMQIGASIVSSLKRGIDSGKPEDIAKSILSVIGTIASLVPGGGMVAGGASLLGSFLREGGPALGGYEIPKARRGAVFMGMDNDGIPTEAHPGEVMMPAHVVNQTFGGIGNAAAVAAGAPLPAPAVAAPGPTYVMAFDAPSLDRSYGKAFAPTQAKRLQARQDGVLALEFQRLATGARTGW